MVVKPDSTTWVSPAPPAKAWMLGFAYAPYGDARDEALNANLREGFSLPALRAQKERSGEHCQPHPYTQGTLRARKLADFAFSVPPFDIRAIALPVSYPDTISVITVISANLRFRLPLSANPSENQKHRSQDSEAQDSENARDRTNRKPRSLSR